ncbi:hypothetical protein [Viridibacillus arvi]|uniref:hypothetical protein n=1 Tax=Viridibacillus arvi TaxID=263475 RepID=UPI0006A99449|nr:hypothetical protein [Viridibacillus arvi]
MKAIGKVSSLLVIINLLFACSNDKAEVKTNDENSESKTQVQEEKDKNTNGKIEQNDSVEKEVVKTNNVLTEDEILKAIKTQLKTDLSKILPSKLPLSKGKHLTATTKSSANYYEVVFMESDKPIAINNKALKNKHKANVIARLNVKKYSNLTKSSEQIAFEDYSKLGGQKVNLGYGITGYQDAGAGSVFTSWNEGRWALNTRSLTTKGEQGVKLAKEATKLLETNTLPIPKPNGLVHLDVERSGNRITWQKDKIVYTIDQVKDPLDALRIATSFEN